MQTVCHGDQTWIRLERGESLMATIREWSQREAIASGWINAIGAVTDPEIGYYDGNAREYIRRHLSGDYELLSCQGNLTLREGEPVAHLHVVLADRQFGITGGHLFDARVAVTVEMQITHTPAVGRSSDEQSGLFLWNLNWEVNR